MDDSYRLDVEQLQKLLQQPEPEGLKLDFKRKLHAINAGDKKFQEKQWNELVKDILALANGNLGTTNQPGYLIIGVADKLNQSGSRDLYDIGDTHLSEKQLLQRINTVCTPPLPNLFCDVIRLQEKKLLVITIPPTPYLHETIRPLVTPHTTYHENSVFIRRKEDIGLASTEERKAILAEKQHRLNRETKRHDEIKRSGTNKDAVYYKDNRIIITGTQAALGDEIFTIAYITSVSARVEPVNYTPGIILFLLGLASTLCSFTTDEISIACVGFGILVLIVSILIFVTTKPKHILLIRGIAGEKIALQSIDKDYIDRISLALNDALHGRPPREYENVVQQTKETKKRTSPSQNDMIIGGVILLILVCLGMFSLSVIFGSSLLTNSSSKQDSTEEISRNTTISTPDRQITVSLNPMSSITPVDGPTSTKVPRPTTTYTVEILPTNTSTPVILPTDTVAVTQTSELLTSGTPLPSNTLVSSTENVISVDNWEIQVEDIITAEQMTFQGKVRKSAGRFVLVFLAVTNRDLAPDTFVGFGTLEIEDAEGRHYEEDAVVSFWAEVEYDTDIGAEINPDETAHVVVAFDIPTQNGPYKLVSGTLAKTSTESIILDIP